jgi:hypothetical protein
VFHVKDCSDNPILYWQVVQNMVFLVWLTYYSLWEVHG